MKFTGKNFREKNFKKFNLRLKTYLLRNDTLRNEVGGFKIDGQHENFWAKFSLHMISSEIPGNISVIDYPMELTPLIHKNKRLNNT